MFNVRVMGKEGIGRFCASDDLIELFILQSFLVSVLLFVLTLLATP